MVILFDEPWYSSWEMGINKRKGFENLTLFEIFFIDSWKKNVSVVLTRMKKVVGQWPGMQNFYPIPINPLQFFSISLHFVHIFYPLQFLFNSADYIFGN